LKDADIINRLLEVRDEADRIGDMSLACLLEIAAERIELLSKIADMNMEKF